MNQGARDANEESSRRAANSTQEQILAELKNISFVLRRIANNTSRNGSVFAEIYDGPDSNGIRNTPQGERK